MNCPQSIKFIENIECLEEYNPPEYLPDEFDAIFRYNDGKSVELSYGACEIIVYDTSAIEKTKDLKFGDLVRLKVR